jgi:hypothetical protein
MRGPEHALNLRVASKLLTHRDIGRRGFPEHNALAYELRTERHCGILPYRTVQIGSSVLTWSRSLAAYSGVMRAIADLAWGLLVSVALAFGIYRFLASALWRSRAADRVPAKVLWSIAAVL